MNADTLRGQSGMPHHSQPSECKALARSIHRCKQPGSVHVSSNPVIDVDGDTATAETDFVVMNRGEDGRAKATLVGRYRDEFRRVDGRWLIYTRTGVSVARPGEAGTDTEWARALERMDPADRARLRT